MGLRFSTLAEEPKHHCHSKKTQTCADLGFGRLYMPQVFTKLLVSGQQRKAAYHVYINIFRAPDKKG